MQTFVFCIISVFLTEINEQELLLMSDGGHGEVSAAPASWSGHLPTVKLWKHLSLSNRPLTFALWPEQTCLKLARCFDVLDANVAR